MKSYLRFLSRNKLYAAIEVMGLSLALGFIIILASYAKTEFSVGTKQPLSKEIYIIGTSDFFGMTLGTAEEFFPSIPEIKSWTRMSEVEGDGIYVTIGEDYYHVTSVALDTNFLKLFDYNLTGCSRDRILDSDDEVIISESFAKKAFAGENPVGRTIECGGKSRTIVGVLQDFGPSDVFKPADVFMSMELVNGYVQKMDQFGSVHTFVTLNEGADPDDVATKLLDKYCEYWDFFERDASNGSFLHGSSLTRLDEVYFSGMESYDFIRVGNKKTVEVLLIVALVVLISAIFNYINLTVAQTGKRAKEMATRRLMGESQSGVMRRYVFESFLFTLGCFALGCVLALCLQPWMNSILEAEIVLSPDLLSCIFAVLLVCAISLAAGLLPAVMASHFKPIDVVKGNFRFRSKMVFSRVFIVCQNVISTVLIAVALTMTLQMRHLVTLPTGYNTDGLISLKTYEIGYQNMDLQNDLAKRLRALPQVEAVGMYVNNPLQSSNNGYYSDDGKLSWISITSLDTTSFRLLGFNVLEQYGAALEKSCWFTEDARDRYEISEQNRTLGREKDGVPEYECCGIISDFRAKDALVTPMEDSHNVVMIRSGICAGMLIKVTGDRKEAFAAVADVWRGMTKEVIGFPTEPDMNYLVDELNSSLTEERNTMTLVSVFMILSILISALGLFAMSVYFADQQKKSISLHKVFGAETGQAVLHLSRPFIMASLVAIAVATPVSVIFMRHYLEGFYNRIDFPWWVLLVTAVVSLLINGLCILSQTLKTASANPVESIKSE